MAAIVGLLAQSMIPAALGLAVAITASTGYASLSAWMSDFDSEVRAAIRDLSVCLATYGSHGSGEHQR